MEELSKKQQELEQLKHTVSVLMGTEEVVRYLDLIKVYLKTIEKECWRMGHKKDQMNYNSADLYRFTYRQIEDVLTNPVELVKTINKYEKSTDSK